MSDKLITIYEFLNTSITGDVLFNKIEEFANKDRILFNATGNFVKFSKLKNKNNLIFIHENIDHVLKILSVIRNKNIIIFIDHFEIFDSVQNFNNRTKIIQKLIKLKVKTFITTKKEKWDEKGLVRRIDDPTIDHEEFINVINMDH